MIGLPKKFLQHYDSLGGGVIQTTASESTLTCLLAAKMKTLKRLNLNSDEKNDSTRLVVYCSNQVIRIPLFNCSKEIHITLTKAFPKNYEELE